MTTQSNTAELSFADVRSFAARDLDLGITMIDGACVRSPPFAAFGSRINPARAAIAVNLRSPMTAGPIG
jgi:hypothetical protein